jgi:hypothetical protein
LNPSQSNANQAAKFHVFELPEAVLGWPAMRDAMEPATSIPVLSVGFIINVAWDTGTDRSETAA